jgi:hypothetical protein
MRSVFIALFISSAAALVYAQPGGKPNFSGTWVMNAQESKVEIKNPPVSSVFKIVHQEPAYHWGATHVYQGGKSHVASLDLITDAKHKAIRKYRGYKSHIRMYWEGDVLVFDERAITKYGTGTNVVRYSLSTDGNTLTAIEHDEIPSASWTNRWVFDRQADPGPGTHN